jgi:3-hydroxyacyl-[acyl-carrier-protein] dehydratase
MSSERKTPIDVLPHRPPFLFIDRVVEASETSIKAVRTFRADEEFFKGHFPGNPIVPGVLLVEAMAQALAYLAMGHEGVKGVYLTGIDRARFRKPVLPGQEAEISIEIEGARLGMMSARGEVRVGGVKVADARLSGFAEK